MPRRVASTILVLMLVTAIGSAGERPAPLPAQLAFQLLDGSVVSMGDLRGKVVLLDFWATWCLPCRDALPHLRAIARRFADKPFVLLSISVDQSRETLERFLGEEAAEWPHVWDDARRKARIFGVESFPTYIVIDHHGRVAGAQRGWGPGAEMRLLRLVGPQVSLARRAARRGEN